MLLSSDVLLSHRYFGAIFVYFGAIKIVRVFSRYRLLPFTSCSLFPFLAYILFSYLFLLYLFL